MSVKGLETDLRTCSIDCSCYYRRMLQSNVVICFPELEILFFVIECITHYPSTILQSSYHDIDKLTARQPTKATQTNSAPVQSICALLVCWALSAGGYYEEQAAVHILGVSKLAN